MTFGADEEQQHFLRRLSYKNHKKTASKKRGKISWN
jgi:hypothetical protein